MTIAQGPIATLDVVTPCRGAATRQGGGKRDNVPKKSEQSMMDPRKPSHRASV